MVTIGPLCQPDDVGSPCGVASCGSFIDCIAADSLVSVWVPPDEELLEVELLEVEPPEVELPEVELVVPLELVPLDGKGPKDVPLDVDPPEVELPEVELLEVELLEVLLPELEVEPLDVELPELEVELPEVEPLEVVPPGMRPPGMLGPVEALSGLAVTAPSPSVPPPPPQPNNNSEDDHKIRARRLLFNLLMSASRTRRLRHRGNVMEWKVSAGRRDDIAATLLFDIPCSF